MVPVDPAALRQRIAETLNAAWGSGPPWDGLADDEQAEHLRAADLVLAALEEPG